MSQAAGGLIALDWGTSRLRAWHLDAAGRVLDARQRDWGILRLPDGGFEAAFADVTDGWNAGAAIACGMVGSRQGWREAAYLPTPAGLPQLAASLLAVPVGGGAPPLLLVPGLVCQEGEAPDVMRGEETQAVGAMDLLAAAEAGKGGEALLVMPGTHCKWTRLASGRVTGFRTMMTGELFDLLLRHSILGRFGTAPGDAPPSDAEREAAFAAGVLAAQPAGALARLFSMRAQSLTGRLQPGSAPEWLSGLLIGEELRVARAAIPDATIVALTGDAALCARYAVAFGVLGFAPPRQIEDTAMAGLRRIAQAAGLLAQPGSEGVS